MTATPNRNSEIRNHIERQSAPPALAIALTLALLTAAASAMTPTTAPDRKTSSSKPIADQCAATEPPSLNRPHIASPVRKARPAGLMLRLLPYPIVLP